MFRFLAKVFNTKSHRVPSQDLRSRLRCRPQLECLEGRAMPSVVFDWSANDSHVGLFDGKVGNIPVVNVALNDSEFNTFKSDAHPMIRVRLDNGSTEFYTWQGDLYGEQPGVHGVVLERTADPQSLTQDLGLKYSSKDDTWRGHDLKWFLAKDNSWYYVAHNGLLFKWDRARDAATPGSPIVKLRAASDPVAAVDPAAYKDPLLLVLPENGGYAAPGGVDSPAALQQRLGLKSDGNFHQAYGGLQVKWIQGKDNEWYFIRQNGRLWKWDGTPNRATGTFVGTLDTSVYDDPTLLVNAQTPLANADQLHQQYGFHRATDGKEWLNWLGKNLNEKWFQDRNNAWYFITKDGHISKWDGGRSGTKIARVAPAVWSDLNPLFGIATEPKGDIAWTPAPRAIP